MGKTSCPPYPFVSETSADPFAYLYQFGIGALGINYLYGTEVAPLSHRVPIYALTSGTLWTFNFLVVEITPVGFSSLGYKFFIVFAVIDICLLFPGKCKQFGCQRFANSHFSRLFLPSRDTPTISRRYGPYLRPGQEPNGCCPRSKVASHVRNPGSRS